MFHSLSGHFIMNIFYVFYCIMNMYNGLLRHFKHVRILYTFSLHFQNPKIFWLQRPHFHSWLYDYSIALQYWVLKCSLVFHTSKFICYGQLEPYKHVFFSVFLGHGTHFRKKRYPFVVLLVALESVSFRPLSYHSETRVCKHVSSRSRQGPVVIFFCKS